VLGTKDEYLRASRADFAAAGLEMERPVTIDPSWRCHEIAVYAIVFEESCRNSRLFLPYFAENYSVIQKVDKNPSELVIQAAAVSLN
jgi:hypothetical protein